MNQFAMNLITRRNFLLASASVATLAGSGVFLGSRRQHLKGTLLSAFEDARGDQYIGGVSLATDRVFGAKVPMRAHGCAVDPTDPQRVLFFARRPGTQAFELRRDSMKVRTVFATGAGRHLAGHGLFSRDGSLLYTPEHDYERVRGVVAVRDARNFRIVDEIDTHGIDPHEVAWLPDGRSLLVANGGIMTHPRSFRRKLNIPTMDPSLCVIDARNGDCRTTCSAFVISQWLPMERRQSDCNTKVIHSTRRVLRQSIGPAPDCSCWPLWRRNAEDFTVTLPASRSANSRDSLQPPALTAAASRAGRSSMIAISVS
jgi:hypothetical protein